MKTIVGFCFTEQPLKHLAEMGLLFQRGESYEARGYREFLYPLSPHLGLDVNLEIREILNEDIYFTYQDKKNFESFEYQNPTLLSQPQFSPVEYVQGYINSNIENSPLKDQLNYRKPHSLWAVWIKSENFENILAHAKDEKLIIWRNQPALLISMGQSCYDLLITL